MRETTTLQNPASFPTLLLAGLWAALLLFNIQAQAQRKPKVAQVQSGTVPVKFEILNQQGSPVSSITDGDLIKQKVSLEEEAALAITVAFTVGNDAKLTGRCIIPLGKKSCETELLPALG